jgi:tricorn protease
MKKVCLLGFSLFFLFAASFAGKGTRFLYQPDTNGELIAFIYAGDLWTVPVQGGTARRLTSHPGLESNPRFSPDGKWIAFSAEYDGNTDVYLIPCEGGEPKRLTYHPSPDIVQGWTPDGAKILFKSGRTSHNRKFNTLFTVGPDGGFPEELPIPMAEFADWSPDGRFIAYNPIYQFWQPNWRRYRGGTAPPVWIVNLRDYSSKEIPRQNSNDMYPCWLKDTVYFLSDRNRVMNLFSYNTRTEDLKQLINHGESDIKYLGSGGGLVVYGVEGYLYVYEPGTGQSRQVVVSVSSDLTALRPDFKYVATEIASFDLSPTGRRAAFEAHGEILTVPAEKGDCRNITRSPGAMDRYPAWSPDGKTLAYFSDAGGEYALYLSDQMGKSAARKISLPEPSFYYQPFWSPDSRKIALTDKKLNIWCLDVGDDKPFKVDVYCSSPAWSPDSRWLAYKRYQLTRYGVICLYSLDQKKSVPITDGMSDADIPCFDRSGQYLIFAASTNTGPLKSTLDMSSRERLFSYSVYLAVLRDDIPSPLAPLSDEEKPETKENEPKDQAEPAKPAFRIDLEGISQRIISLPVKPGVYVRLGAADDGSLFILESSVRWEEDDPTFPGSNLWRFDFNSRKSEPFLSGIGGFTLSADGKKLLYKSEDSWFIVPASGKPNPGEGKLDLSSMTVRVDPHAEWEQMFRDAWRLNRDFFYDPDMHGVDWKSILEKYSAYLPDLAWRGDLNELMSIMLGELCVGHSYVRGGVFPTVKKLPGGLLGANYELAEGRYRIRKIYGGLNWTPALRAPLTEPGVRVKAGDYILRVNGKELTAAVNIYSLFENTAGRQVKLLVSSSPQEAGGREVVVVPVESERLLRLLDWIEGNRRKVAEMTGGRVGYIYLPDTGNLGFMAFNRYFYSQTDKEGLVIDERFNDGGHAANSIIDTLAQPLLNYWAPREGPEFATPFGAVFGPKVMIINEYAGSGGDAMPFYFRERGVGPLVGKRTWGGLVGIGGEPLLMDGGYVTAPSFGAFSKEGKWLIENEGVPPDYEVEYAPALVVQGHDPQLEKAVELVLEALKNNPPKKTARPAYPIRN